MNNACFIDGVLLILLAKCGDEIVDRRKFYLVIYSACKCHRLNVEKVLLYELEPNEWLNDMECFCRLNNTAHKIKVLQSLSLNLEQFEELKNNGLEVYKRRADEIHYQYFRKNE